jgi:hypothetical protein
MENKSFGFDLSDEAIAAMCILARAIFQAAVWVVHFEAFVFD